MGRFDKGRKFGGNRGFSGNRDRGPRQMHRATCGECGESCKVPFRPTGERPVLCSFCFEKQGGGGRSERSNRSKQRERPRFQDNQMHDAVCDKCGADCQVPFRPTPGKEIFCNECFSKNGGSSKSRGATDYSSDFKTLNEKLDKLISLLVEEKKPTKKTAAAKVGKKTVVKKTSVKKKIAKKATKKKSKTTVKKTTVKKKIAKKK